MRNIVLFLMVIISCGCSHKPQEISYGKEECTFCRMTIVDPAHAAQLVSLKGKNFKFDATECMIHYLEGKDENSFAYILAANLASPGEMINAKNAVFIISPNIPSPMGAYLSTVDDLEIAREIIRENTGKIYTWDTLKEELNGKE